MTVLGFGENLIRSALETSEQISLLETEFHIFPCPGKNYPLTSTFHLVSLFPSTCIPPNAVASRHLPSRTLE